MPDVKSTDLAKHEYLRSYRRIVMYEDLNSAGSIFGGRLVSWIDEGSAIYAACQMNARKVVTKKISELIFNMPARLGDMLEIWCKSTHRGRTSLTIDVIVTRRTFADDPVGMELDQSETKSNFKDVASICHCQIVFVSVDGKGVPRVWNVSP